MIDLIRNDQFRCLYSIHILGMNAAKVVFNRTLYLDDNENVHHISTIAAKLEIIDLL